MAYALDKLAESDQELPGEVRLFLDRMWRETLAEMARLRRQVDTIEKLLGRGHSELPKNNSELTNMQTECIMEVVP